MTGTLYLNGDAYRTINPIYTKSRNLQTDVANRRIEADSEHHFGEVSAEHSFTEKEDGRTVLTVRAYLGLTSKRAWIDIELDLLDDIEFLVKAAKLLNQKALKLRERIQALDELAE